MPNRYDDWMKGQFGSMIGNSNYSPVMPQTTAQELTSLGGKGFEQQAAFDSFKQDAALNSSPNPVGGEGGGEFDFKAISKALGGGEDTFKFDKPNMTLSRGTPPPVQALPAAQPQQPLSTAMGAIESANQLYGMPQQQQPQQQPQPAILRRMLGLA